MWLKSVFGVHKPVIALLHIRALPGDPQYGGSMQQVLDTAAAELVALQNGGVDGILLSNEFSMPYELQARHVTSAAMARIVGELRPLMKVPYGMNIVRNPYVSIEVAAATDAAFVRSTFTGAYMGEAGIMQPDVAACVRRRAELGRTDLRMFYKVNPESDTYLAPRELSAIVRSVLFNCAPDALCVSGMGAGKETDIGLLEAVKANAGDVPVFCNTGCTADNVVRVLQACDGVCVGTALKENGAFRAHVDQGRVEAFMDRVLQMRGGCQ